ncbi:TnsA-like heteromeric transposase endonuclease subunit [Streptomyces syringium]|uniref:TnsA-like heteromeric transposase endonuclease subunit n=1 Tax=Streptomyces syringium TaxID=76729 RepID=UPI00343FCF72
MGTAVAAPVRLSVRRGDESVVEDLELPSVPLGLLREARPWRMFRWYKGQQHYSGTYWSATVGDRVIYESRLELGRLLFADFAPEVRHIIAQPFMLKADVDGKVRKHIPDYLLVTDDGPVVVDVKPRHRLEKPEIAFTFAWTDLDGMSLGDAFRLLPQRPRPLVKSSVLHLLWSGHVTTHLAARHHAPERP